MTDRPKSDRPNFLFITTDQQRADHLGCYGNDIVQTPAIDGLAAKGVQFENFYVACPICMPNRVAILTGRMPSVNGTRHNGIPLPLDAVTFVDILQAGGYHTGLVGKSHAQNITGHPVENRDIFPRNAKGTPSPPHLADVFSTPRTGPAYEAELMPLWHQDPDRADPPLPYYGYDFVRFANGHADHVQGHYTKWLAERSDNPDGLRGQKNALPAPDLVAPQAWRTAMPEDLYPTSYIAETTRGFIDQHLEDRPEDPFFVHCSFTDPHHPFTPPGRFFDMYNADDMPLPASFVSIDPHEPSMLKKLREQHADGSAQVDGPTPFCVDAKQTRQILALTYGMISMVDEAVAGLLNHLEEQGILDNTIVIFTSDHGDFMGDHGLMLKHGLHYEGVLRVPFIWSDPTLPTPATTHTPGSSIDISATILARAGLAPNNGNQGQDIIGQALRDEASPREGILIEEDELGAHLGTEQGLRTRTFIMEGWRLTLWQGMADGQLFNRSTDPDELKNLWFDAESAAKKYEIMEAMLREMIRLEDTGPYATHLA